MSYAESGDEQSEDGELRQSPPDSKQKTLNTMDFRLAWVVPFISVNSSVCTSSTNVCIDFSLSEEEGDNIDSLDIKPPQARVSAQSSRSKRREGEDSRSRHKRGDRHRDEGRHSHREKHHR